jgi:hypothetical protein
LQGSQLTQGIAESFVVGGTVEMMLITLVTP